MADGRSKDVQTKISFSSDEPITLSYIVVMANVMQQTWSAAGGNYKTISCVLVQWAERPTALSGVYLCIYDGCFRRLSS